MNWLFFLKLRFPIPKISLGKKKIISSDFVVSFVADVRTKSGRKPLGEPGFGDKSSSLWGFWWYHQGGKEFSRNCREAVLSSPWLRGIGLEDRIKVEATTRIFPNLRTSSWQGVLYSPRRRHCSQGIHDTSWAFDVLWYKVLSVGSDSAFLIYTISIIKDISVNLFSVA